MIVKYRPNERMRYMKHDSTQGYFGKLVRLFSCCGGLLHAIHTIRYKGPVSQLAQADMEIGCSEEMVN